MNRIGKLSYIFTLIFGLVFVLSGALGLVSTVGLIVRCSETTVAVVAGYHVETTHDDDGDSTSYYPVFEYSYNGLKYTEKSVTSDIFIKDYSKGDSVTVHFNPDNPEEVYDKVSILLLIAEMAFFVSGVWVCIKARQTYNQVKMEFKETLD